MCPSRAWGPSLPRPHLLADLPLTGEMSQVWGVRPHFPAGETEAWVLVQHDTAS